MVERLQIYMDTYKLSKLTYCALKEMPKYDKHLIGARMITSILDMFEWITLANNQKSASERLRYLESFYTSFEQYKIQLRLCEELKFYKPTTVVNMQQLVNNISKQLNGWIKSTESRIQI